MAIWLIVIVLMVVLLTVLSLLRTSKVRAIEKFQNTSGLLGSTNTMSSLGSFLSSLSGGSTTVSGLKTATTTLSDGQINYANNVLGKEVLTNAAMPNYANVMATAVNQPDVYLNTPDDVVVRNLQTDNNSQFTNADIQFCKSALMPVNLPPRARGSPIGCGWYYVPNPNITSSGALGQAAGPLFPKGPNSDGINGVPGYGNGQWIWDLALAQQLEETKNCARIKSCIAIDAPSVVGVCGFCIPSGVAIPVNVDGTEKYTKSKTINNITAPAVTCDAIPIMSGTSCPVPPGKETPLVTPQGISCGNYGYPSQDYSIRLYNQDDCTRNMDGNWVPNGECLMQGGGSYSAACSPLNGIKPASPEPSVCAPDINGKISNACLIGVAKSLGYTQQGAMVKLLQTKDAPGELDKVAMQIVKAQNISIPDQLYKGGIITVADAIKAYDRLYNLIKDGTDPLTQQAAMWLCVGTSSFDPCNLPDNTPGPFIDQCVQQQWRIAGCQPAGTEYPAEEYVLNGLNTLTWGKVKAIFQDTFNAMAAETDSVKQDVAVLRCLGINTKRSNAPPCAGISRNGLVLNADSAAFRTPETKSAYTLSGKWKSSSAVYAGSLVATGTKVSSAKGVQFDGSTVLGTPNLVAQLLGLPFSKTILNGPDATTVSSPMPPTPPPPILSTWFLPIGDIGMGINSTEQHSSAPFFLINADRAGWQPAFRQMHTDIANGVLYKATVTGNNSKIKYTFKVTQCADGSSWVGWFGNPDEKKSNPILFGTDTALSITIQKFVESEFESVKPILFAAGLLGDIGYPHFGISLGSDQRTNFNIAFKFYNPIQSSDGTLLTLIEQVNDVIKSGKQSIQATVNVPSKGLSFTSGPVTKMSSFGWFHGIAGTGAGPVVPAGDYYLKQNNGKNIPPFTAWDELPWTQATVTLNVAVSDKETRELWINPNVDTCEILAIFTGPSYSETYTAMALHKGELVIALNSVEKGYTFFNAGKIPVGQWSHIVHTYEKGVHNIFINGAGPVTMAGLTRENLSGYIGYSLGGGSKKNPLYQRQPRPMPFQGEIGAFRVYNRVFGGVDVQSNLAGTIDTYVNRVEFATKNDPNALAMAAGKFYVPSLAPAINYQPAASS